MSSAMIALSSERHLGPRISSAGMTLRIDTGRPYSFSSTAEWPPGESYEAAVRGAIEAVLVEKQGSLARTEVVLVSIEFHPIHSSQNAFERVAAAAVRAALDA